jgi:hypothetical protein
MRERSRGAPAGQGVFWGPRGLVFVTNCFILTDSYGNKISSERLRIQSNVARQQLAIAIIFC